MFYNIFHGKYQVCQLNSMAMADQIADRIGVLIRLWTGRVRKSLAWLRTDCEASRVKRWAGHGAKRTLFLTVLMLFLTTF